jgi:hypothetical protein
MAMEVTLANAAREICVLPLSCRQRRRHVPVLPGALERAARLGAHGPLAEERYFLVELIG